MLPAKNDGEMHILDHVRELRKRLIVSVIFTVAFAILGFCTYNDYVEVFLSPLGDMDSYKFHSLQEAFMIKFKISFYVGLTLSLPIHVYNVIAFVLPALKKKERRMLSYLVPASTILALVGTGMAYFYVVPWAVRFMQSKTFNPMEVEFMSQMNQSITLIVKTIVAFVLLFQTPLLMLILMALNLISRRTLLKSGRYAMVGIFLGAAILTPPDLTSQFALALPLIFLYYLSIFLAKLFGFGACGETDDMPTHQTGDTP